MTSRIDDILEETLAKNPTLYKKYLSLYHNEQTSQFKFSHVNDLEEHIEKRLNVTKGEGLIIKLFCSLFHDYPLSMSLFNIYDNLDKQNSRICGAALKLAFD
jgi:hypothetical protein